MNKLKNLIKKSAAWAVLLSMTLSEVTNAFAANTVTQTDEDALKSELYVSDEYAKEHPNGVFTFYQSKIVANEGDGTAEIKVVRKGGSAGKATVKFKAVDVTSAYGTDYTLSVGNSIFSKVLDANPNAEKLIDKYADEDSYNARPGDEVLSDAAVKIMEEYSEAITDGGIEISTEIITEETTAEAVTAPSADSGSSETETTTAETTVETTAENVIKNSMSVNMKGQNALMNAVAAYTGANIQKPDWKSNIASDDNDEEKEAVKEEVKRQTQAKEDSLEGVDCILDFDEGEVEKTIVVNIKDDDVYKNESFFFVFLTDCNGAEIDDLNSGYVVIEDNDTVEKAKYSISSNAYEVDSNAKEAEIKVVRTSGLNYLDAVNISTKDDTAKAGQDYVESSTKLLFPAGVTERTFTVPLMSGRTEGTDFYVVLDNKYGNVDSKAATAKVKFVKAVKENLEESDSPVLDRQRENFIPTDAVARVNSKDGHSSSKVSINRELVDQIDVEYEVGGGTDVCDGRDTTGSVKINVNGKEISRGISNATYTDTISLNGESVDNVNIYAQTGGKNSSAYIKVNKVIVYSKEIRVTIDNSLGENNIYVPKAWSPIEGAYLYTDKRGGVEKTVTADKSQVFGENGDYVMYYNEKNTNNTEKLQIANLSLDSQDDATSKTVSYGYTVLLKNNYLNNWDKNSAYLDHYILRNGSLECVLPASDNIKFDKNFMMTYGDYINKDGDIAQLTIVPVYKPKTAFVQIANDDSSVLGSILGTEKKTVFKINMGDYIAVQSTGNAGHYTNKIVLVGKTMVNNNEYSDLTWKKEQPNKIDLTKYTYTALTSERIDKDNVKDGYEFEEGNITKAFFPISKQCTTIYPIVGDTNLKVSIHPKQNANADKGAVIYTDGDGNVTTTDENYTLNIKKAELEKNYIFKGVVNKTSDGCVKFEDESKDKSDIKIQLINHKGYDLGDVLKEELENGVKTDKNGKFDFNDFYRLDASKEYEFTVKLDYNDESCSDIITVKNGQIDKKIVFTVAKDGKITSSKEDIDFSDYVFYWKDGTFSNPDGSRTAEQTAKAKSYGINTDLSYAGSTYSHILKYYDSVVYYTMFKKDEAQYESEGEFSGNVYYTEREIFSGETIKEPIFGCSIYAGDQLMTTDSKGHFTYKFDKGYSFFDVFSLVINYNGKNYSSQISADQEKNYVIDAEEVISYSNPILLRDGYEIGYNTSNFDNGDRNYTIKVQVNSNEERIQPYKTYFTAYNDGIAIGKTAVPIVNGFATYEFNPSKYVSDDNTTPRLLNEGTTFKISTEDMNHTMYTEMNTGLSLAKYVESRGVDASIVPESGTADLFGSFATGFDSAATADEKTEKTEAMNLSDDEVTFINSEATGNVDTNLAGNVKFDIGTEQYKSGIKVELINDKGYTLSDAVKNDVANGAVTDEKGNFYFNNFATLDKDSNYEFTLKFTYENFSKSCKIKVEEGKLVQRTNFVVGKSGITSSQEDIVKQIVNNKSKYEYLQLGFALTGEGKSYPTDSVPTGGLAVPRAMSNAWAANSVAKTWRNFKKATEGAKETRTNEEKQGYTSRSDFKFGIELGVRIGWVFTSEGCKLSDVMFVEKVNASVKYEGVWQTPWFIQVLGDISFSVAFDATEVLVYPLDDGNVVDTGKFKLGNMYPTFDGDTAFTGSSYWYTDVKFDVAFLFNIAVGWVGLNIGIGGEATYGLENLSYRNNKIGQHFSDLNKNEVTLTLSAKAKFIIVTLEWKAVEVTFDFTKAGNNKSLMDGLNLGNSQLMFKDANSEFGLDDLSYLDGRDGWTGSSSLLKKLVGNKDLTTEENQLIDRVYEDAHPQIENIGDGKYLVVYCDRIPGSTEKTGIYYSVFNGNWSEPKLISSAEDTSTEPSLINTDDKAYVAWTATKSLDNNNVAETLNSTDIRMSVFDKNTLTFGEILDVTYNTELDTYSESSPVLSRSAGNGKE